MVDHALHLAMLALGVAAFFVVPTVVAVPILLLMTGGAVATVVAWQHDSGLVRHRGELWRAEGPAALTLRTRVRILSAKGTVLLVQRDGTPT
jgi:hypothetical protein